MTDLIQIEVRLYGTFRKYAPGEEKALLIELSEGSDVTQVLEHLAIPAEEEKVILVNGRPPRERSRLRAGDTIVVFSPVTGG